MSTLVRFVFEKTVKNSYTINYKSREITSFSGSNHHFPMAFPWFLWVSERIFRGAQRSWPCTTAMARAAGRHHPRAPVRRRSPDVGNGFHGSVHIGGTFGRWTSALGGPKHAKMQEKVQENDGKHMGNYGKIREYDGKLGENIAKMCAPQLSKQVNVTPRTMGYS